jgi:hypothetical protein
MFHPVEHPMERGWVGRIEGDHVVHLAAQTLQSFFTGGGSAREHAVYPRAAVRLLAPVLHPPAVRVFEDAETFAFANPAAIVDPDGSVPKAPSVNLAQGGLALLPRLAGVVGADEAIAGLTVAADWRDPSRRPPKDRDFALGLGPVVVTPEDAPIGALETIVRVNGHERFRGELDGFDWAAARDLAADGTALFAGDLLVGPALGDVDGLQAGDAVEIEVEGIGTLRQHVGTREPEQ